MRKKPDRYFFPAVFTYEDNQEIAVEFPNLDVATCGKDDADALLSARELLGITLLGLEEDGEDIPTPSKLSALSLAPNQRAALIDVYMPAVRVAGVNKAVTRTVTLPAWLNAAALAQGFDFSEMLQEALKERLGIEA